MYLNIDLKNEECVAIYNNRLKIINKTGKDIKANEYFECKVSAFQNGGHKTIFLNKGKSDIKGIYCTNSNMRGVWTKNRIKTIHGKTTTGFIDHIDIEIIDYVLCNFETKIEYNTISKGSFKIEMTEDGFKTENYRD
jgi:hypothetical protein